MFFFRSIISDYRKNVFFSHLNDQTNYVQFYLFVLGLGSFSVYIRLVSFRNGDTLYPILNEWSILSIEVWFCLTFLLSSKFNRCLISYCIGLLCSWVFRLFRYLRYQQYHLVLKGEIYKLKCRRCRHSNVLYIFY